ncbi:MAG: hypothetical protein E6G92_08070 [Alphaproteobacteria bacterium]|nr:MAG: hypothetical protein E6G92_08070 [Alphaproteobacteria bacterium]
MPTPPVIAFTPVPLRRRADGWTPELQLGFILALSRGLSPGEAARSVGKNRQNAYALRKREGAESFAAAWDAVVAHVRQIRAEGRLPCRRADSSSPRPRGAEAEAIAERGAEAMSRARTPADSRRALDEMLDALYGPKSDNSDNSEGGKISLMGSRNL